MVEEPDQTNDETFTFIVDRILYPKVYSLYLKKEIITPSVAFGYIQNPVVNFCHQNLS